MSIEYSVVWRFRERTYGNRDGYVLEERRKVYKTLAGAGRLLAKLRSNDGHFDKTVEYEATRYDDGYAVEHLVLDYARLEWREVGGWRLHESEMAAAS